MATINKKVEREYFEKKLDARTKKVQKEVDRKDATTLAQKVEQFRKTHKHFDKIIQDVDMCFRKSGDLEEAYKKACKMNDLDPEESGEKAGSKKAQAASDDSKKKPIPRTPRTSEDTGEEEGAKKTFKSPREAAEASLKAMLANDSTILSVINDEEPPEKEESSEE